MDSQKYCDVTAAIQHEQDVRHAIFTAIAVAGLAGVAILRYFLIAGGC